MFEWIWIGGGIFMIGVLLYLLLESEIDYPKSRNRFMHSFMKHPTRFEIAVQILMIAFPVSFCSIYLIDSTLLNEASLSMLLLFVFVWPYIMYIAHERFIDFSNQLGLSSKTRREIDPVLKARAAVVVWIVCLASFIFAIISNIYNILPALGASINLVATVGLIIFPLRKSLRTLRASPKSEADEDSSLIGQ